jgi:hypothetical protein
MAGGWLWFGRRWAREVGRLRGRASPSLGRVHNRGTQGRGLGAPVLFALYSVTLYDSGMTNTHRHTHATPAAYAVAALEDAAAAADYMAELVRARHTPARCTIHPAFDADYCPTCGTTTQVGDR